MEPQYRCGSRRVRPFASSAKVSARGCSRLLQRAVTDFGVDVPYAQAMDKLVEHYDVVLSESTIRRVVLHHARCVHERSAGFPQGLPEKVPEQQTFVAQLDGSMVPTVRAGCDVADRRKGKCTQWEEVKLSLAHAHGSRQLFYGATLEGETSTAGKQLRACAKRAGLAAGHHVHGLGDGAPWIAQQFEQRFGKQGSYLLDFYHVCGYLAAAANAIENQPAAQEHWLEEQKRRLKSAGGLDAVLRALACHREPDNIAEDDAPVRQCWRYLNNRLDQLDYPSALERGLPIGSGEIESAHRYVVQRRLKLPGAWWSPTNAQYMLSLRVSRANAEWDSYWARDLRFAA
jgi:hypothetical protein